MNWKFFLKPDWKKIVLIAILFGIGIVISILSNSCLGCYNMIIGFPLVFYEKIFWPRSEMGKSNFSIFSLTIDIIFWYLFSCLIIWIYDKVKKK